MDDELEHKLGVSELGRISSGSRDAGRTLGFKGSCLDVTVDELSEASCENEEEVELD